MDDPVRVWLVERTHSHDEQNLIILIYATPDGRRSFRKERALTSFTGPARETPASLEVGPDNLGAAEDPDLVQRFADEAARMADRHRPVDTI